MDKVSYLQNFINGRRLFYDEMEVIYPLILSLSAAEALQFFDLSFEQHYQVRQWAAKKISDDMRVSVISGHQELISDLTSMVNIKGFSKRETCGYILMTLIDQAGTELQHKVITVLLASPYRSVRERAYKRLQDHWDEHFFKQIAENWERSGDGKCLKVMLRHFPAHYLLANFDSFKESLSKFDLTGLFLRYQEAFNDKWDVLRETDEVSYVYVLTKLGKTITVEDANAFIATNYLHDRIGLLLWCFGKMGLWDALVNFNENYRQKIWDHKVREYRPVVLSPADEKSTT